jgi:hypothetical protein
MICWHIAYPSDTVSSILPTSGTRALRLATVTNQLSFGMQQAIFLWIT